jgi:hypothetical protein
MMLRCIMKCARRVTVDRSTAPFVRAMFTPARRTEGPGDPNTAALCAAWSARGSSARSSVRARRSSAVTSLCTEFATLRRRPKHFVTAFAGQNDAANTKRRRPIQNGVLRRREVSPASSACNLQRSVTWRNFRYHSLCRGPNGRALGRATVDAVGSPSIEHSESRDEIV